ncbi:MAG: AsmA family protein, partial [Chitinophagaceae bacterium]
LKLIKKTLKISVIIILTLILLAFIVPVVFKKQVQALVKKEINKQLNAKVDFKDIKLSLFRHFPKATIRIKGLSIAGTDFFAKDTLIAADNIDVTSGLYSILNGKDIKVYGIYAQSPSIHLLNNKFGKANWDIIKSTGNSSASKDTAASSFKLMLEKYKITNGYLVYNDRQANSYLELNNFSHEGSGELTADAFTLSTHTQSSSANFTQDEIPYLINTKTELDAAIKIDTRSNTYTFKTDDVQLNALNLSVDGMVQLLAGGGFKTDIKFSSPTNEFKNILSMIPAIYTKDFAGIKTSGQASFNGFVSGIYSSDQMPGYDINLVVKNASFKYPDLPKPVSNINLILKAANPDGKPDHAIIDIPKAHIEFGNEPFDFNFTYRNPETIQYIDAGAKGKLDLSELSKFFKLEPGTKLGGQVWADAFARGPLKSLQQQSGAFSAGGFFDIKNLFYSGKDFPQPIQNGNIKATLTNAGGVADKTVIDISSAYIEVGKDPVEFSLQLRNPVSSIDFSGYAKGKFTLGHLKQFTSLPAGTSLSGLMNADISFAGSKTAINKSEYDKITLTGNADISNVTYKSTAYPSG